MISTPTAAVFGAYGHTGRFIVTELRSAAGLLVLSERSVDSPDARRRAALLWPERRSCLHHAPEESGCLVSRKRSLAKRLPSM